MTTRPMLASQFATMAGRLGNTAIRIRESMPDAKLVPNTVGNFAVMVADEYTGFVDMWDGQYYPNSSENDVDRFKQSANEETMF